MNRDLQRVEVELEEDAGSAAVVVKHACVVGHAVLICVQRLGAWRNVCRRYDVEEVLIRDEGYITVSDRMNGAARVHSRSWVSSNELSRG